VLFVLIASTGYSQTSTTTPRPKAPDFTMQVRAGIVEDFNARVGAYVELRDTVQKGTIRLTTTEDPAAIERAEKNLARMMRAARTGAKQGDVFTPAIREEFKRALVFEMNAATWHSIMDDNPGGFSEEINEAYREGKPFSTVPPNILALLPSLPDDVQYLFLGRHLILYDTRSHLMIDRIHNAIACADCGRGSHD
jgi:hypothetical protein